MMMVYILGEECCWKVDVDYMKEYKQKTDAAEINVKEVVRYMKTLETREGKKIRSDGENGRRERKSVS